MFDFDKFHAAITALRSRQVFFLGGAMKSGTTWLQILLDQHPEISCNGEAHFPNHLAPLLKQALSEQNKYIAQKNSSIFNELQGYPRFSEEHLLYIAASAMALLLCEQVKHKPARAIGEKTPDNIRFLPLLHTLFPRAKFVQIVRDGRDCAVSAWFHNLRVSPDWVRQTFGSMDNYVKSFAEIWNADVSHGSKFAAGQPTRFSTIRYEDLCSDPEAILTGLFHFLGVQAGPEIVKECCTAASFEKLSGGRARGQENRASFFRKGTSGDWRNHLTAESSTMFWERAGESLARFGYAP